jgi:outer membrane lipoprotein SlyB
VHQHADARETMNHGNTYLMKKETNMWNDTLKIGATFACVAALSACGSPQTANTASTIPVTTTTATTTSSASGYGIVQAIDIVPQQQAAGIGLGTVAGAVVGGVLGNQVGGGRGQTAATVAGVAGGALAGRELERRSAGASGDMYRVTLRMDNGAVQTLVQETAPQLQIGERVRISNGTIVERFR